MDYLSTDRSKYSTLERFWNEQNERLCSFDSFRSDLGDIYDDVLNFKNTKGSKTRLDFNVFDLPHIELSDIAQLTIEGETHTLSFKEYAKLAVANSARQSHSHPPLATFNILMQLGGFLNINESKALNKSNAEDFYLNILTQKVTEKGCSNRLSPPAYRACFTDCNLVDIRSNLHSIGIRGLIDTGLTKKSLEKKFSEACKSAIGVSLTEYKKGGNFNTLTLEMGQYYIDHLRRVYESDYFYTLVCRNAIRDMQIPSSDSFLKDLLLQTILGTYRTRNKYPTSKNKRSHNDIYEEVKSLLFKHYDENFSKVESLKESNISRLVLDLGLEMRFDAIEIIRILMLQKYYDFKADKTAEQVWLGYKRSFDKSELDSERLRDISVNDIYACMAKNVDKLKLNNNDFMKSLNKWATELLQGQKHLYLNLLGELNRVEDAMTSLVVSWLGYRKSEFGFPLKAITVHSNLDILDNSHVPFRFKLKWLCPKTNGNSKIEREVTSQCYQVAAQMSDLIKPATDDAPCLYVNRGRSLNKLTSNQSDRAISSRIISNWGHFAENYKPFNEAIELERLSKVPNSKLKANEKKQLSKLQESYTLTSARVQHLLNSGKKVKSDAVKIKYVRARDFKDKLIEYSKTGRLKCPELMLIFDNIMPDDTKSWLFSNRDNIEDVLDKPTVSVIISEMLVDVRYPTPHSFRHIWAEAVLTRYQGDVGAVIRHQFCHLDESFFMAYLRDKEAKSIVKVARMKVLNSLVDTLILDVDKVGSEYLGGFSRYIKKAVSMTNAITKSSVLALKEAILGRVISINPSYFANCVPREGGEGRAKCADMGDINPQNAKPMFCLGCTHVVITKGNLRGIWQTVQPFVKECLNEDVMGFMVQSHLPTLRSSYKRINELKTLDNIEAVNKILLAIEHAITSVEKKLKAEKVLYEC